MTAIANLRHRLTLEAPEDEPDGAGGVVRVWNSLGQVWAAIEPLGAGEAVNADKRVGALSHRIVLRHRDGLDLNHRFRLGSRIFTPRTLRDRDERGRYLECLAGEERP
jgi:SPP1 family predicted phage head-tail adaptor